VADVEVAEMEQNADQKMSRAEAGRKGGLSTKQRYGGDHFSKIGRLGGKKGGESTKRRYGVEFYQRIGRKGGSS
jgi:general stress protein YciG